jgi:hypothetical protein
MMTNEQKLAEKLHQLFCTYNHTDACAWQYEVGSDDVWNEQAHNRWLECARLVLTFIKVNGMIKP